MVEKSRDLSHEAIEGTVDVLEKVGQYPGRAIEDAAAGINKAVTGVMEAGEGILKAADEAVVNTGVKRLVWDDALAGVRTFTRGVYEGLKSATWDTGGDLFKGEWGEATKSFFWDGAGKLVVTPFVSVYNQVKGLLNMPVDLAYGTFATGRALTGIGTEGERRYGLVPGTIDATVGVAKTAISPISGIPARSENGETTSVWTGFWDTFSSGNLRFST